MNVYVGKASDMTGAGDEHDAKLKGLPEDAQALQVTVGEDTVVFTTPITGEEYVALVKNGAEEI